MIAAAAESHSYYDKMMTTVGVNAGQIGVTAGQVGVTAGQVGVTAGQIGVNAGAAAAATSEADSYVHYGGHVFQVPAGAIESYNTANVFTGYTLPSGQVISVDDMMKAAQYSQVGIAAGQAAAAESMEATHVMSGGMMYTIPVGAEAQYNSMGDLTGYFSATAISGGSPVYEMLNGVNTMTGYSYPIAMMTGEAADASVTVATAATAASAATNCNSVSPVANGIAQYNHHGCITGYVVKNSNLMMLI